MNRFFTKASLFLLAFFVVSLLVIHQYVFAHNTPECAATGTITSVKSGNWSDPATWGGKVPTVADTVAIAAGHTVIYDKSDSTVAGVDVACHGTIAFDATKSVTLQSTKNVLIKGVLQMRPNSFEVIQTLRFIGINENNFVGGGMNPLASDIGLWVMGDDAQLDAVGSQKTSWTNVAGTIASGSSTITLASAPIGWQVGDEIAIAPTESPTVGGAFKQFEERTIKAISGSTITLSSGTARQHPKVNNQWTAEVMNLTRNVRIEGTSSGKSHVFIRSMKPQTIKYIQIRYNGPRKDRGGSSAKELVSGRYGIHFHHSYDGSRGTIVEGNVVRDTDNHSYVTHQSNGITLKDNIAYNVTETAYWWDPSERTHDALFDHNIAALIKYVPGALNMNAEDAPTFAADGFLFSSGDGNRAVNNVVVGQNGDPGTGAGFDWEATLDEGVWDFKNNTSHNNDNGLRTWQNTTKNHIIENFVGYYNALGIFHGAYANSYRYVGGAMYGNEIEIKAASANTNGVRFENMTLDGGGIIDYVVRVVGSPVPGEIPIKLINNTMKGYKVAAVIDESAETLKKIDIIGGSSTGTLAVVHPQAAAVEVIRVQPSSGQPYQITRSGITSISPFAPTLWGNGTGLTGEYFNNPDLTNLAVTRTDSNVSFSEWGGLAQTFGGSGVHHALTDTGYSVRWTGQIQPQVSGSYTFTLGSGGGHRLWINDQLIINSWTEHFPGVYNSTPISLVAGHKYNIKLEFFNTDDKSGMNLYWAAPNLPQEYVPQSQLYPSTSTTPPVNTPPVVTAGIDQIIALPISSITLSGTAADTNSNGSITSVSWTKVSGGAATIASPNALATIISNLAQGTYVFRLTATDNQGLTASDEITVTVNPPLNTPPMINAGVDQTITLPVNSITLNAIVSDFDDSVLKMLWTKTSGGIATIVSPSTVSTQITGLLQGIYVFQATATDSGGLNASDSVMVTVNAAPNVAPVVNVGTDQIITLPVSSVTLAGTATDSNGDAISYAWTKVSGGTATVTSPSTASTTVNNLVQGTYVFRLTATDAKGAASSDDIQVVVKAQITTPPAPTTDTIAPAVSMTSPAAGATVSGNSVVVSANATDNVGVTEVKFILDNTIELNKISIPPYSYIGDSRGIANGSHTLKAVARDAAGNSNTSSAITITVDNSGTSQPDPVRVKVNVDATLNVRAAPQNGTIIGVVTDQAQGTLLDIQSFSDGSIWVKVQFQTMTGWVHAKYVVEI